MSATLKAPWNLQSASPRVGIVRSIANALRGAYDGRGAAKAIARDAVADTRTAEAWLYADTAPRSPELLAMMAANDQLEEQILAIVHEIREQKHAQRRAAAPLPPVSARL